MRGRRVGLFLALLVCVATIVAHAPAGARADSITLTFTDVDGNVDPTALVPRTVVVTSNVATVSNLYVKFRPAGGPACAANAHDDPGTMLSTLYDTTIPFAGPFTFDTGWIFPAPGMLMLCIWVVPGPSPSEMTPVTPIAQLVSVRPATATISLSNAPGTEPATPSTTVTVAGASDFPLLVRATYRPVNGVPCATTWSTDPGTTFVDSRTVTSGRFTFAATIPFTGGAWLICAWLETDATVPVGIPQNSTFTGPATSTLTASGQPAPPPIVPTPLPTPGLSPAVKLATTVHSTFPKTSRHLRLSVSSRVAASTRARGACRLEVLQGGRWKTAGTPATVTAKGTCLVSARFVTPGRKRVRVVFHPAAGFVGSDSPASWVIVRR